MKDCTLKLRCTQAEMEAWGAMAGEGRRLSEWIRAVLNIAAGAPAESGAQMTRRVEPRKQRALVPDVPLEIVDAAAIPGALASIAPAGVDASTGEYDVGGEERKCAHCAHRGKYADMAHKAHTKQCPLYEMRVKEPK